MSAVSLVPQGPSSEVLERVSKVSKPSTTGFFVGPLLIGSYACISSSYGIEL